MVGNCTAKTCTDERYFHSDDAQMTYTLWDALLYWILPSFALAGILEWLYQRDRRKRGIPPCPWYG